MSFMIEPGHLLDGNMDVHPRLENFGSEVLDKFDDEQNNLKFLPQFDEHGILLPWMLGVPNRVIHAGEEFGFAYGPDHWKNKFHFETLPKNQQLACFKYYKFKKEDLVKQGTPVEPLATPPRHVPNAVLETTLSNVRSSPARPARGTKK